MKMLAGFFTLALSFGAFASTVDTKTFYYDGSQNSVELILNAEKTRTEYRSEDRTSICYRQVFAGNRMICTGGGPGYPYPGPGPGRYPRQNPAHCWTEPTYRTEAYSCIQRVTVSYDVWDHDVEARVIVDVTNLSQDITPGETIKVSLFGDTLTFDAIGSKKFFVVKKKQDVRSSRQRAIERIDAVLAIELVEAAPVLNAIQMNNLSVSNDTLNFNVGPIVSTDNLGFDLKVVKTKTFGSDTVLLDRKLNENEVELTESSNGSMAQVYLNRLGVRLASGKYSITAKMYAKFKGELLNSSDFSELSASKTLIYKIR